MAFESLSERLGKAFHCPRKGTGTGNGGHDLSESGADGCKNRS